MTASTASSEKTEEIHDLLKQWRAVMAASRPRWSAADLTFTQLRALSAIAKTGPLRVSALAEQFDIGLAAASSLADRMVQRKFISRRADPDDRRIVLLELSPRGKKVLEVLERGSIDHFGKLIARMTPTERAALATTLRAFVRLSAEHTLEKGPHQMLIVRRREAKC